MSTRYVWGKYTSIDETTSEITDYVTKYTFYSSRNIVADVVTDYNITRDPNGGSGAYFNSPYSGTGQITNTNGTITNANKFVIPADQGSFFYNNRTYSKHVLARRDGSSGWTFYRSGGTIEVTTNPEGKDIAVYGNPKITSTPGDFVENVSGASRNLYPDGGGSGYYYYDYKGSDTIDPTSVSYSKTAPEPGDSITISVSPKTPTYGGTIYYQFSYSIDGGNTWSNIGGETTSTNVSMTIPTNATQFQARAVASDGWGFTSSTYVKGPSIGVTAEYKVSLSVSPSGAGSVTGGGTYTDGTSITVTASAYSGYSFYRWEEGGSSASYSSSYTFSVTNDRNLTAVFRRNYSISLSVEPAGGGTVSGGGSKPNGTSATVRATPAEGFEFVCWKEGSAVVSTSTSYTFTVSKNRSLTAVFKRKLKAYVIDAKKVKSAEKIYLIEGGKVREVKKGYVISGGVVKKFL